jgi:hypothetical protein
MALFDMKVFNQYIMPATIETLAQMVDKFNGASNGAIRLTTAGFTGDFLQESFFAAIPSARRRVDRNAAQAAAPVTDLTQLQLNGVKVAGGFGPIRFEPSQMTWLQKESIEGIEVASKAFAEALIADQLNTLIASSVAAIGNQGAATTVDVSGTGALSYATMNSAHALFGDNSASIVASVISGATYHSLIGQNLANGAQLFVAGNVQVVDILGRPVIVTDAPALYSAGTPNKQRALGLVSGAATVYDGGDVISNIETTNGQTRIETTMQVDYTFGVALKGYSWDVTNGGKSPSDAELATGSNWDKVATDIKHTAGVMAIGLAA